MYERVSNHPRKSVGFVSVKTRNSIARARNGRRLGDDQVLPRQHAVDDE